MNPPSCVWLVLLVVHGYQLDYGCLVGRMAKSLHRAHARLAPPIGLWIVATISWWILHGCWQFLGGMFARCAPGTLLFC